MHQQQAVVCGCFSLETLGSAATSKSLRGWRLGSCPLESQKGRGFHKAEPTSNAENCRALIVQPITLLTCSESSLGKSTSLGERCRCFLSVIHFRTIQGPSTISFPTSSKKRLTWKYGFCADEYPEVLSRKFRTFFSVPDRAPQKAMDEVPRLPSGLIEVFARN